MTPALKSTDPVFDAAHKVDAEDRAAARISTARARLILRPGPESAFFAALLLRLDVRPCWGVPTMAVDGRRMVYNPDFTLSLTDDHLAGVLIHETLHVALLHHVRRKHREPVLSNIAADLSVNFIVLEAGFTLPDGALFAGKNQFEKVPVGLSYEENYALLEEMVEKGELAYAAGGDPGGCGLVEDASDSEAGLQKAEREWKQAVAEAAEISKTRGTLPGSLAKFVDAVVHSPRSYKEVLRRFLTSFARSDHTWSRPNRRFAHRGLVLPSLRAQALGTIALNIDVSGSTWPYLERFAGEFQAIVEAYDVSVKLSYSDTKIQREEDWGTGDAPLRLEALGGGGTDHHCVFEWLAGMPERPSCIICLTDMYTATPDSPPDVPVLWVIVANREPKVPWGESILMDAA